LNSSIGKIERGVANPTLSTIVALARALQIPIDVLLPPDKIL
jgi:transcriptional regulator with XRE-family HTH domain